MEKDPNLDQKDKLLGEYEREVAEKAVGAIVYLFFAFIIPSLAVTAIRLHSHNSADLDVTMTDWRTVALSLLTLYGTPIAAINCFDQLADLVVLHKKIKVLDK